MMFSIDIFGRGRPKYTSKEEPEQLLRTCHAAWHTMILFLLGTLLCALLFGAYLLTSSLNVVSGTNTTGSQAPDLVSSVQLAATARNISERQELFALLKSATSSVSDPSR